MSDPTVTACVLIIGNEILSGRTQDANLAYIAQGLARIGVRLREARVIPDVEEVVVGTLNELRAVHDYVFTTGGIGPTHDDITAACVAKAFGVELIRDPRAVALLQQHYGTDQINEARLRMANVPKGADLIHNPVSSAPGFRIGNVFVMAGVPRIMQAMFDGILPTLKGGPPVLSRTVTTRLAEGDVAVGLEAVQERHPKVEIGSYPFFRAGKFGVSLVLRSTDPHALDATAGELCDMIRGLGDEPRLEEPS